MHCESRYYVPDWCRWLNGDSIGYLDPGSIVGLNLFAYCYNAPVNFVTPSGHSAILVIELLVGSFVLGTGARNSAKIASSMKLTCKGTSAVKIITTASNRYLAREISMKGLQATTRLWGNVALNAVQDALTPTIRSLMINEAITIAGVTIGTAAANYGLSYLY